MPSDFDTHAVCAPPQYKYIFKEKKKKKMKGRKPLASGRSHLWSVPCSLRLPSDREPEFEAVRGTGWEELPELNCPKQISNCLVNLHAGLTPSSAPMQMEDQDFHYEEEAGGRPCDFLLVGVSFLQEGYPDFSGGVGLLPTSLWTWFQLSDASQDTKIAT